MVAAVAQAAATEMWQGIMEVEVEVEVVVLGGNGGQPCKALQRSELEIYICTTCTIMNHDLIRALDFSACQSLSHQ